MLLELAVQLVIQENVYHVVPLPGMVWEAVRRNLRVYPCGYDVLREETGDPWDIRLVMEDWAERRWGEGEEMRGYQRRRSGARG